jgi:crossover junction endodeoxyribonuclease RuvC
MRAAVLCGWAARLGLSDGGRGPRMIIIGIDPGITGAIAVIERTDKSECIVDVIDLPIVGDGARKRILVPELMRFITAANAAAAFIEDVHAMPREGVASAFKFGRAVRAIEATIACVAVPSRLVQPKQWKKHFSLHGPDKEPSRQLVISRLPQQTNFFARKCDHGRAEAVHRALRPRPSRARADAGEGGVRLQATRRRRHRLGITVREIRGDLRQGMANCGE